MLGEYKDPQGVMNPTIYKDISISEMRNSRKLAFILGDKSTPPEAAAMTISAEKSWAPCAELPEFNGIRVGPNFDRIGDIAPRTNDMIAPLCCNAPAV